MQKIASLKIPPAAVKVNISTICLEKSQIFANFQKNNVAHL